MHGEPLSCKSSNVRFRIMGDEPDYLPPYNPRAVKLTTNRADCRLPPRPKLTKPRKPHTDADRVTAALATLRWLLLTGHGWDDRRLRYGVHTLCRRIWTDLQDHALTSDPRVTTLLRRAKVQDPYRVHNGAHCCRRLTTAEMKRCVVLLATMRAEAALAREKKVPR